MKKLEIAAIVVMVLSTIWFFCSNMEFKDCLFFCIALAGSNAVAVYVEAEEDDGYSGSYHEAHQHH